MYEAERLFYTGKDNLVNSSIDQRVGGSTIGAKNEGFPPLSKDRVDGSSWLQSWGQKTGIHFPEFCNIYQDDTQLGVQRMSLMKPVALAL